MENLRKKFDEQERSNREDFEHFVQKRYDSAFVTNLLILRMRVYHYKELLKLFAQNFRSSEFEATRTSVYLFLFLPSAVSLGFNMVAPFSIFRNIGIYSSFGGSVLSFVFSFKDEMHAVAQNDQNSLGF